MDPRFFLPEDPERRHAVIDVRSRIRLAMELVPDAWPMDTFIHHNPLNGLEDLPFEEAVRTGESLFGGKGYPSPESIRGSIRDGRIGIGDLEQTFGRIASRPEREKSISFGGKTVNLAKISLSEYLLAPDLPPYAPEAGDQEDIVWLKRLVPGIAESLSQLGRLPEIGNLYRNLEDIFSRIPDGSGKETEPQPDDVSDPVNFVEKTVGFPGERQTFSGWVDRLFGTEITEALNALLSDATSLYLDEGQAFWAVPGRERGFYRLFRDRWASRLSSVSSHPLIPSRFSALPDSPEEAILRVMDAWQIPRKEWVSLFSREFSALPGWSGAIKWRGGEHSEEERLPFRIEPGEWLAIRVSLESVMIEEVLEKFLKLGPSRHMLEAFMRDHASECAVRYLRQEPSLPLTLVQDIDRLVERSPVWGQLDPYWEGVWERCVRSRHKASEERFRIVWSIFRLCAFLGTAVPGEIGTDPEFLEIVREWHRKIPRERFGYWGVLAAEKAYRDWFLSEISARREKTVPREKNRLGDSLQTDSSVRAQVLFCIDVRSEGVRRHLEHTGPYETAGLAGFLGIPIRFRGFGSDHVQILSPAILSPRHMLAEIHRPYEVGTVRQFFRGRRWLLWLSHLVHEMKNNIVTPYVFVEAIGWMSGLPLFGKTFFPGWYHRLVSRSERMFVPAISTTIPLDKISEKEAHDIVLSEERSVIRQVLFGKFGQKARTLPQSALEEFRFLVLSGTPLSGGSHDQLTTLGHLLGIGREEELALIAELREVHQLRPKRSERRLEELSRMGLTHSEQVAFAETALSLAGLHRDFAPLVVFVAHKSTSENNPYESALDCGACGGQDGTPNARVSAALLNRPSIRKALEKKGIRIPDSTWFLAGVHDTTTDQFRFFDGEDWPVSHERLIREFISDIHQAGQSWASERLRTFPGKYQDPRGAPAALLGVRSHDWAEVRPEWGLSGNAAFFIGRRNLTRGIDLGGRVFLQEYDDVLDPTGKILETLLSGPLVVGRWINLEHYFSTVDNTVYGSGSKVSHNVVGRFGVQFGNGGDLRMGLPWQTVFDVRSSRHQPVRLLCVISAPRDKVDQVLRNNLTLVGPFDRGWALLVVMDSVTGIFWEYRPEDGWREWTRDGDRSAGGDTLAGSNDRGIEWKA